MTKTTDICKILGKLNDNFFPITLKNCSITEHFNEFLNVVDKNINNSHPIHTIAPTHNQVSNFKRWDINDFAFIPYWTKFEKNNFETVLQKQIDLSRILDAKFSKTIFEYFNKDSELNGRLIIKITLKNSCRSKCIVKCSEFIDDSKLIEFIIPQKPAFDINDLHENISENGAIVDIFNIEKKEDVNGFDSIEKELKDIIEKSIIKNNTKVEIKFLKDLIKSLLLHTIYINENTELFYSFSNIVISSDGESDKGIGGLFLLVKKGELKTNDYMAFKNLISISDKLAVRIVMQYHNDEVSRHATRSAISQVLARNMSHNINSHVSYRATNINIKERIKELYKVENNYEPKIVDWIDFMSEKLDKYEIYRNEYLADFDQVPKNLKFYEDVLLPFCENTLIMDNIAASENIFFVKDKVNNKLRIECHINGEKMSCNYPNLTCIIPNDNCSGVINYPENFPYLLKNSDSKYNLQAGFNRKEILPKDNEIEVSMHSEQAFYSILENVIRNSAKHNKDDKKIINEGLKIFIDLRDDESKENFILTIYDNVSKIMGSKLFNNEVKNLGIHQRLRQNLLDDSGGVRRENWGFADIRINSFLFFNKAEDVSNENLVNNIELVTFECENDNPDEFKIVEVKTSVKDDTEYRFGYQMKISKAKKILWIGDLEDNLKDSKEEFKKSGFVKLDKLTDLKEKKQDGIAAYDFVVINSKVSENDILDFELCLPRRILVKSKDSNIKKPNVVEFIKDSFKNTSQVNEIMEVCWQQWLKRIGKQINMYLYFNEQGKAVEWKINGDDLNLYKNINFKIVNNINIDTVYNCNYNIFYDHHNNTFEYPIQEDIKALKFDNKSEINFYTYNTHIWFDKGSEDFNILNNVPATLEKKKELAFRMTDSATTNIFILDERILQVSDINSDKLSNDFKIIGKVEETLEKKYWRMYAASKVFVISKINKINIIPSIDIDLNMCINIGNINFNSKYEVLKNIDNLSKDIFIIHRTYLEDKKLNINASEFIEKANKIFGSVYITSGGGKPHNMEMECKFIPFSIIEKCISSRISKYKLTSII